MYIYRSIYLSIHHNLPIILVFRLRKENIGVLQNLGIYLFIIISIYLILISVYLTIYLSTIYMTIHLSIIFLITFAYKPRKENFGVQLNLGIYLSIYLSFYISTPTKIVQKLSIYFSINNELLATSNQTQDIQCGFNVSPQGNFSSLTISMFLRDKIRIVV